MFRSRFDSNPLVAALTACLAIGAGCASDTSSGDDPILPPDGAEVAASQKSRLSASSASTDQVRALTEQNTAFAVDMYHALGDDTGNLFFSPHSISIAFAMLYAGAEGETETQMREAMHFAADEPDLHHAFNALDLALTSRNQPGLKLRIVNASWGATGHEFMPDYLDVLAENYGAGMYLLDFAGDSEGARSTINQWVSDNTEGRIEELMGADAITSDTRLALTNAVYFKGDWKHDFDPAATEPAPFTRLDGSSVEVEMMTQEEELGYREGDGWVAVEMPYAGGALSMIAVVPQDFASFEANLDAAFLNGLAGGLPAGTVHVWFPRLSYGSKAKLIEVMQSLGMLDAFDAGRADLSGIDGARNLFVQAAVHEANIDVTEEGTEAAAGTGIGAGPTSVPIVQEVRFDRPFVFAIVDRETGAVVFLGRVLDPSA